MAPTRPFRVAYLMTHYPQLAQTFIAGEIAEKLGISYETVHTYIRRIYEKLQVRTRTEAVAKFLRRS